MCTLHVCVRAQSCLDSLRPHGLQPARFFCPWKFPDKNSGAGCHFLLQGILPNQGLNPHLLHLLHDQADSLPRHHLGSPIHYMPESKKKLTRQKSTHVALNKELGSGIYLHNKSYIKSPPDFSILILNDLDSFILLRSEAFSISFKRK